MSKFEKQDGLLYRLYQHLKVICGKWVRQVVVPHALRQKSIEVDHDSLMIGHLGVRKTYKKTVD